MQRKSVPHLHALNALKLLAIALVFNSHSDGLYPISSLATGGALGNALFFAISGYLSKTDSGPLSSLLLKRVLQLYPGMLVATAINLFLGAVPRISSPADFFLRIIWPTGYWFVGGLLVFSVILFVFEKIHAFDRFAIFSIALWSVYMIVYIVFIDKTAWHVEDRSWFRCIYYFFVYAFGYALKTKKVDFENISSHVLLKLAIIGIIGNIGWKIPMAIFPSLMATQFLTQLFCTLFASSALLLALRGERRYKELISDRWITVIDFLSGYSLEIYFAQRLAQWIVKPIFFPLNLLLAIALTLIYALPLKYASKAAYSFVGNKLLAKPNGQS